MGKYPIIKNAGYMWHRKYVDWQGATELIGYPEEGDDEPVNFAFQAGIYSLYNNSFKCVYVGQAGKGETGLYNRLKEHALNDYLFCMWERFCWFGLYSSEALKKDTDDAYKVEFSIHTDVNKLMDLIETLIIHVHLPPFNMSMGPKLSNIKWYYQKAEFEEKQAEFKRLKKQCKSLRNK